jgi:anti-sigma factor RsiW
MICQEVMELMQRYIDGDLDQQETSLMMDHTGQCPDCAAMLTRLQRLSSELEQLPRVVPKFSLVDAILPELDRIHAANTMDGSSSGKDPDQVPVTHRSYRPSRHLFGKLSGVVAAGVVAGLLLFGNPGHWSITGGTSSNDAAAPSALSAPAASGKVAVRFSEEMKIADSSQSPELKSQKSTIF